MKYALVTLALAAFAQAQTRNDIPVCARDCLDDAVKSTTSCATTDYACVCKSFDKLQGAATPCVIEKCGSDVAINKVLPAVQALCAAQGTGGGSSAAATTSAAAPPSSAAASPSAAATTTSVGYTVPVVTTSAETETPSSVVTIVSTPSSNATASVTKTTQSTLPTAGAAAIGSVGGLAMLALAALAL